MREKALTGIHVDPDAAHGYSGGPLAAGDGYSSGPSFVFSRQCFQSFLTLCLHSPVSVGLFFSRQLSLMHSV